jgi:ubiquinone/menaquinone biosynthesis C-methylase UbiE
MRGFLHSPWGDSVKNSEIANEWTGLRGMIGGWLMASPARRVIDLAGGNLTPRFLEVMAISGDEIVVDVGCGSGYFSVSVAERLDIGRLICVDASSVMLRHLERRLKRRALERRVDVRFGDVSELPIEDSCADLVFTANLLHELPQPEVMLAEAWRVLRPGGKIAIADFRDTPRMRKRIASGHPKEAHGVWSDHELRHVLTEEGFSSIRVEPRGSWLIGSGFKE